MMYALLHLLLIQDELGLSRELMFKLPPHKKWELYLSKIKVSYTPNTIITVIICIIIQYIKPNQTVIVLCYRNVKNAWYLDAIQL